MDLWMTAVVVTILNTYYSQKKVEWKLVEKKSIRCLKGHTKIVGDAQKFINKV